MYIMRHDVYSIYTVHTCIYTFDPSTFEAKKSLGKRINNKDTERREGQIEMRGDSAPPKGATVTLNIRNSAETPKSSVQRSDRLTWHTLTVWEYKQKQGNFKKITAMHRPNQRPRMQRVRELQEGSATAGRKKQWKASWVPYDDSKDGKPPYVHTEVRREGTKMENPDTVTYDAVIRTLRCPVCAAGHLQIRNTGQNTS